MIEDNINQTRGNRLVSGQCAGGIWHTIKPIKAELIKSVFHPKEVRSYQLCTLSDSQLDEQLAKLILRSVLYRKTARKIYDKQYGFTPGKGVHVLHDPVFLLPMCQKD